MLNYISHRVTDTKQFQLFIEYVDGGELFDHIGIGILVCKIMNPSNPKYSFKSPILECEWIMQKTFFDNCWMDLSISTRMAYATGLPPKLGINHIKIKRHQTREFAAHQERYFFIFWVNSKAYSFGYERQ